MLHICRMDLPRGLRVYRSKVSIARVATGTYRILPMYNKAYAGQVCQRWANKYIKIKYYKMK